MKESKDDLIILLACALDNVIKAKSLKTAVTYAELGLAFLNDVELDLSISEDLDQ